MTYERRCQRLQDLRATFDVGGAGEPGPFAYERRRIGDETLEPRGLAG